ncbi:MAG: PPC domain-containing protein, partial [Planctomycetes bacterium]|nr:PPC domain-containing protein [Planctomycetota bacterium]
MLACRSLLCRFHLSIAVIALSAAPAVAQRSYPMLMSASPLAIQAGTTAEHTVQSRYSMHGAFEVLIAGDGVRAEIVPPEIDAEKLKPGEQPQVTSLVLKLTADADAQPGPRDFRIATAQGPSTIGQFVVVRDAIFRESGKNDTAADAPLVELPAALCGAIEKDEDIDCYRFKAEAGATWTFCVHAARCEDRIHDLQMHVDPILTLRSADGGVLAVSDNEFFADPAFSYQFKEAGEYLLEIRDVRYEGNTYWQYCIEAIDRPLVTNVHPLGVVAGSCVTLEPTGFNVSDLVGTQWESPADLRPGFHFALPLAWGQAKMNPVPVVVHDLSPALEGDETNDSPADAELLAIPSGVSGRIEHEGDVDIYGFEAKKGDRLNFEIVARRHGSALDPIIALLNEKGARLIESDDYTQGRTISADALIENWAAPADGKYYFEVRDLHGRGGPAFVYLLKATHSGPAFHLDVDTDKTVLTPGTSGVIFVRVTRKNDFAGPIELAIDGLPEGVTASSGRILAGAT